MPEALSRPKPVVLLILDGWGHREEPQDNALAMAELPNWHRLLATHPHVLIHTEGRHVGLPDGQMGNSEVGHMNLGAGRIVYQDLTRIDAAIEDGSIDRERVASCLKLSAEVDAAANQLAVRLAQKADAKVQNKALYKRVDEKYGRH